MTHIPMPVDLYLVIAVIYYLVYEFVVVRHRTKDKEEKYLEDYSQQTQDYYHSRAGKTLRVILYSLNVLLAFGLLVLLVYNFWLALILFVVYQLYFLNKLRTDDMADMMLLYLVYHVPFYVILVTTMLKGGLI